MAGEETSGSARGDGRRVERPRVVELDFVSGIIRRRWFFADVMTALLLRRVLPTIEKKSKLRVLDYCSGNGVIAEAVRRRAKKSKPHLLDADALALEAAKKNLDGDNVQRVLSDGWTSLDASKRFDLILSNPPVHLGLAADFAPLREFLRGLPLRLTDDGVAYFVAQRYVPTRARSPPTSTVFASNATFSILVSSSGGARRAREKYHRPVTSRCSLHSLTRDATRPRRTRARRREVCARARCVVESRVGSSEATREERFGARARNHEGARRR